MDPYFQTRDLLKSRLRLSGIHHADAEAQLDRCIGDARVWLYDALGSGRLQSLATLPSPASPASAAEYDRLAVELLEVRMTYYHMLRTMTTAALDGSSAMNEWYKAEGAFRLTTPEEREEWGDKCKADIEQALSRLGVLDSYDTRNQIGVMVIGNDYPAPVLGRKSLSPGAGCHDHSAFALLSGRNFPWPATLSLTGVFPGTARGRC